LANRLETQAFEVVQSALDGESSMLQTGRNLHSLLLGMHPGLVSRDDFNLVRAGIVEEQLIAVEIVDHQKSIAP
jgi:hypothetical protein